MLSSLGILFLVGLSLGSIISLLRLPKIIGYILAGIIIGPYVLDLLDPALLNISADLRQLALVIILIKAGLSLNISDLKKVGRPAILLCFLPASFEIVAYTVFAPIFLKISYIEAALMGSVLAAVSPAVVVPRMVKMMEEKRGTSRSIPQMIMAGASCDDIFVIVLFSTFLSMAAGNDASLMAFFDIPSSIILGITGGIIFGLLLAYFYSTLDKYNRKISVNYKVIILLGLSFMLLLIENVLKDYVAFSGLLAIISMAATLRIKDKKEDVEEESKKMGALWVGAEVMLFVLVGAAVDIRYTMSAGFSAIALILVALLFRAVGVYLTVLGTKLSKKERIFVICSYLPKATVQAAIGSVALNMGLPCGKIILSVAVLGILITAPLGAILMDNLVNRLVEKDDDSESLIMNNNSL